MYISCNDWHVQRLRVGNTSCTFKKHFGAEHDSSFQTMAACMCMIGVFSPKSPQSEHLPCIHFLINSENCEKWGVDFLAMESPNRLSPLVLDGAWPWGLGFILTTPNNALESDHVLSLPKTTGNEGSQWKNDLNVAQQQLSNFNIGL